MVRGKDLERKGAFSEDKQKETDVYMMVVHDLALRGSVLTHSGV